MPSLRTRPVAVYTARNNQAQQLQAQSQPPVLCWLCETRVLHRDNQHRDNKHRDNQHRDNQHRKFAWTTACDQQNPEADFWGPESLYHGSSYRMVLGRYLVAVCETWQAPSVVQLLRPFLQILVFNNSPWWKKCLCCQGPVFRLHSGISFLSLYT